MQWSISLNGQIELAHGWRREPAPLRTAGGDDTETDHARSKAHQCFRVEPEEVRNVLRAWIKEREIVTRNAEVEQRFGVVALNQGAYDVYLGAAGPNGNNFDEGSVL